MINLEFCLALSERFARGIVRGTAAMPNYIAAVLNYIGIRQQIAVVL